MDPKASQPLSYRIAARDGVGRVLEACRTIEAGEVILIESPLLSGPHTMKHLVCLECQTQIDDWDTTHACSQCAFPLCSPQCDGGVNHVAECAVFRGCVSKPSSSCPDLTYLLTCLPLRTLFKMDTEPETWAKLDRLMDHLDDMLQEDKQRWQDRVVSFIRDECNFRRFSSHEILRSISIFLTNGVNQGFMRGHAIYDHFSLVSHSCVNNSRFQVRPDRRLVLRSQTRIPKGSEITAKYLPTLIGNSRRRPRIRATWHFTCLCPRCSDPSECGSMIDAVVCRHCLDTSKATKAYMLQNGELNDLDNDFVCTHCLKHVSSSTVLLMCETLEEEHWSAIRTNDSEVITELIEKWQQHALHPNHYLLLKLKMAAIEMLCNRSEALNVQELTKVIAMGMDVLDVMQKVEPGLSLNRGRILRQLHPCRLKLLTHQYREGGMERKRFRSSITSILEDMKTAINAMEEFSTNPRNSTSSLH